jgi:hypothetical protein
VLRKSKCAGHTHKQHFTLLVFCVIRDLIRVICVRTYLLAVAFRRDPYNTSSIGSRHRSIIPLPRYQRRMPCRGSIFSDGSISRTSASRSRTAGSLWSASRCGRQYLHLAHTGVLPPRCARVRGTAVRWCAVPATGKVAAAVAASVPPPASGRSFIARPGMRLHSADAVAAQPIR